MSEDKHIETDGVIELYGLKLRTFGTKKGVKDLKPVRLMVTDDTMWKLKCASFSAHCSVGELCHAIVMQWLSEHELQSKVKRKAAGSMVLSAATG